MLEFLFLYFLPVFVANRQPENKDRSFTRPIGRTNSLKECREFRDAFSLHAEFRPKRANPPDNLRSLAILTRNGGCS
jgi:hypothetical protein